MYNLLNPNKHYQAKSNESFEKGSRLLAEFSQEFLSGIFGKTSLKEAQKASFLGLNSDNKLTNDKTRKYKLANVFKNKNNILRKSGRKIEDVPFCTML